MSTFTIGNGRTGPANPVSIPEFVIRIVNLYIRKMVTRAIVTGNDGNQVYIKRIGFSTADTASYPKLSGVSVSTNDEVLMLDTTGQDGWVIIGKILRN